MSGSNWFLHRNGQQFGPYTWEQLVQLARSNHVDAADLVWREGDPGSRHASEIPGLLQATPLTPTGPAAAAPARSKGLIAGLAVGVAALAIALVVVIVTRGGGDDASTSSDTTEVDTTEPRDTEAPSTTEKRTTTSTTVAPATTELPTTAVPVTTPPTTPPTTQVPTTLPIATEADLIAALPPTDDLPMGWAVADDGVTTDFDPHSGPANGACGMMNNDMRALESGAVAHAEDPEMYLPDDGFFYITLFAFPTPADAAEFISMTKDQASQCTTGYYFDIVEGDGPDQIDIFSNSEGDGVVWHVSETDTPMSMTSGPADQRYAYGYVTTFDSVDAGHSYTMTWGEIDQYEQYGNIVLVTELYGYIDAAGFGNWDEPFYEATHEVLMDATDEIRDGVITRLENLGYLI